jgi:hypothetical protein
MLLMEDTEEVRRYHIDIVLCIDCSGSMASVIDSLKKDICNIPKDLNRALEQKSKDLHELRIRIVAFRDLNENLNAIKVSTFFVVEPQRDTTGFELYVNQLSLSGGVCDGPKSGLEALAIALGSDWTDKGDKQRHLVVMFTAASAHKLEDRIGAVPTKFLGLIPDSLDELTDIWDGGQAAKLKRFARRLIIFGPDAYPWNTISDAWGQTVYLPSQAGEGLELANCSTMIETLANSV